MPTSGAPCWRPLQTQRWRRRSETRTETQGECWREIQFGSSGLSQSPFDLMEKNCWYRIKYVKVCKGWTAVKAWDAITVLALYRRFSAQNSHRLQLENVFCWKGTEIINWLMKVTFLIINFFSSRHSRRVFNCLEFMLCHHKKSTGSRSVLEGEVIDGLFAPQANETTGEHSTRMVDECASMLPGRCLIEVWRCHGLHQQQRCPPIMRWMSFLLSRVLSPPFTAFILLLCSVWQSPC